MKFKVPIEKDTRFAQELFSLISEHVSDLTEEHEKFPNKMVFAGPIGNEVLLYIREKDWNFKGFSLESVGGSLNALTFMYDSPLKQTEGRFGAIFDEGSLHNKTINGIPGPETTQKIISTYSSPGFMIERTIRPEKKILLIR